MDILVLGGTKFVGRHIVEALLAAGHTVTLLNRGRTADELPPGVERLHADRNDGPAALAVLGERTWHACVDVSGYTPRQVRASAEFLHGRVSRYLFISTVSVYAEPDRHPVLEDDPLLPPAAEDITEVTNDTYGPLKVTCEHIVQQLYGEQATILRPQLIAGPFDHTARTTYWPDRVARGGRILAPGDGQDFFQVIDARDIARFVVTVLEGEVGGLFNMAGPRLTWREYLHELGAGEVVWVSTDDLKAHDLAPFRDLPVFLPRTSEASGMVDVSSERAVMAGLTLTDPAVTARDTRAWSQGQTLAYPLTPQREAEVLAALGH